MEGATFANWIGVDPVRNDQFSDEFVTLTLSLVSAQGMAHRLVWSRSTRG